MARTNEIRKSDRISQTCVFRLRKCDSNERHAETHANITQHLETLSEKFVSCYTSLKEASGGRNGWIFPPFSRDTVSKATITYNFQDNLIYMTTDRQFQFSRKSPFGNSNVKSLVHSTTTYCSADENRRDSLIHFQSRYLRKSETVCMISSVHHVRPVCQIKTFQIQTFTQKNHSTLNKVN